MTWHLQNEGHAMNQKRIRRLMRLMRLMPIYQKPDTSRPTRGRPYLLALLRKFPDRRGSPFHGQPHPTASVRVMPSAVKPFSTATRPGTLQ